MLLNKMIQQEYFVSFDIGTLGAYYSKQMTAAREEDRICAIPKDEARETDVFMDLGKNDATSIGFLQVVGKEYRIVDFYEATNEDIEHYSKVLKESGYKIRYLYLPHDAFAKRLESKKTIAEQFESYGFKVKRVPSLSINAGIQLVRKLFPQFWIDKTRCSQLVKAIENYHHEWDSVKKVFKDNPLHDWSSHANDMLRYMCIGINEDSSTGINQYKIAAQDYSKPDGVINPLTHQVEPKDSTKDYLSQAQNYVNM